MKTLLSDLNSSPGVIGSMLCDSRFGILFQAFPRQFDAHSLTDAAAALTTHTRELASIVGTSRVLDLRYRAARVLVCPAGEAFLVVLFDKAANADRILQLMSAACKKLEHLRVVPSEAALAAAPPSLPPAPTVTAAREPKADRPRRRTLTLAVVAAAVAVLAAVAGYALYPLLGSRAARPVRVATGQPAGQPGVAATRSAPLGGPTQVLLRLSGSDALASSLVPALVTAFLSDQGVSDVGVAWSQPDVISVQGTLGGALVGVTIAQGGASRGFADLLANKADIAVTTRRIYPAEKRQLSSLGAMTSPENEHVLGLDGVAVIVGKANPVQALNREQLGLILSGTARDWSQFGAARGEIHLYLPDDRSGILEVMETTALGTRSYAKDAKRLPTYQAVADAVITDLYGVGIVPMPAVAGARALPVSDLDDPPLLPTPITVASEDYIFSHRLYLYTAQSSANRQISRFVEFALSAPGQAVVRKAGFVELSVQAERRATPAGAPPEYVRLTTGARRLSSTFRFEAGSSSFDTRAQRDLDRVAEYLRENNLNGATVRILGYADAIGGKAINDQLSLERAGQVAQALAQRGIGGVTVAGMGSTLPVADNAGEEGRRRNRRVEIWIAR